MNWKSLQTPFFTVFFIFAFLYLFTKLLGPIPLSVNSVTTTQTDLFTVEGEGEAMATPDQASFTVGVTQEGVNADVAKNEVTEATNAIITALKGLGIEEKDIKTQNYTVFPNETFAGGRSTITGYRASQELRVEVDNIELANRALDAATAQGANTISGVTFTLDDEATERLEAEARKKAIADAKEKAKEIADAAGVRLGRIVSVREGTGVQPPVPMFDRAELSIGAGNAVDTNLQAGENTVRITVSLSYETL